MTQTLAFVMLETSMHTVYYNVQARCPTTNLLLSSQKYGTTYDKWYNWYIVYTTILAYNNCILFHACQGFKKKRTAEDSRSDSP
jgi:hypothetical protein